MNLDEISLLPFVIMIILLAIAAVAAARAPRQSPRHARRDDEVPTAVEHTPGAPPDQTPPEGWPARLRAPHLLTPTAPVPAGFSRPNGRLFYPGGIDCTCGRSFGYGKSFVIMRSPELPDTSSWSTP